MTKDAPLALGQVVRSLAGRDAGRKFVVVALPDEQYALIADGRLRKAVKPKKKKRRHLRATGQLLVDLQQKLLAGAPVPDHEIRAGLEAIEPHEEG